MSIHKIAAKLTVMCAVLDEGATPDADLSKGRVGPALKLAREASALAAAEQARLAQNETQAATLRPAEEIAREMVGAPEFDQGMWRAFLRDDVEPFLPLDGREEEWAARSQRRDAIGFLTRLIEQSRAEGAAAERERLQKASPIALHKPAEVRVGQVWRNVDRARDLVVTSVANGIAKFGPDYYCTTGHMLTLEAWRFIREPLELAGRIRALVQEYAGRWADADDGASDEVLHDLMERLVQAVAFARRGAPLAVLIDDMRAAHPSAADDLEAIVREAEVKP